MKWVRSLSLLIMSHVLIDPAWSADVIKDQNNILIGIFDTAPYNYVGQGTFHQNILDLFEQAGIAASTRFVPFKRGLNAVIAGELDMMVPITKNKKREADLFYMDQAIISLPFHFIKRQDNAFEWKGDFESLIGKRVGYFRGAALSLQLERLFQEEKVERLDVNDIEQMLRLIQSGRIDMGVTSKFSYLSGMSDLNMKDELIPMKVPLSILDLFLVINKKVPNALAILQKLENAEKNRASFVPY